MVRSCKRTNPELRGAIAEAFVLQHVAPVIVSDVDVLQLPLRDLLLASELRQLPGVVVLCRRWTFTCHSEFLNLDRSQARGTVGSDSLVLTAADGSDGQYYVLSRPHQVSGGDNQSGQLSSLPDRRQPLHFRLPDRNSGKYTTTSDASSDRTASTNTVLTAFVLQASAILDSDSPFG